MQFWSKVGEKFKQRSLGVVLMAVLTVRDKVHKPSDWYRQLSVHGIILNVIHSNLYKNQWKEETENLPPTQQNKNFVELGGAD